MPNRRWVSCCYLTTGRLGAGDDLLVDVLPDADRQRHTPPFLLLHPILGTARLRQTRQFVIDCHAPYRRVSYRPVCTWQTEYTQELRQMVWLILLTSNGNMKCIVWLLPLRR